jgi:hypothetical protein
VLKKAGIIVAAAAAGLLAVSPLAFAGEGHHHGGEGDYSYSDSSIHNKNAGSQGLVNASGNTVQAPVQTCNNDVNALGVPADAAAATGGLATALLDSEAQGGDAESTIQKDRSCGDNGASNESKAIVK